MPFVFLRPASFAQRHVSEADPHCSLTLSHSERRSSPLSGSTGVLSLVVIWVVSALGHGPRFPSVFSRTDSLFSCLIAPLD